MVIIWGKIVGGTSQVAFRWLDVASLKVFFSLQINHQQFGLVSTCFNGCNHLWVLHSSYWHAIHLKKAHIHTEAGIISKMSVYCVLYVVLNRR